MARVEMEDIWEIGKPLGNGHQMVHYRDPETKTPEWACKCGDLSEEVSKELDAINAAASDAFEIKGTETGRFSKPSASFEYEDEDTFVRGRE